MYLQFLFEFIVKVVFFIILLPHKIIDTVAGWYTTMSFTFSQKELFKKYVYYKQLGSSSADDVFKKIFETSYDVPSQVYFRKLRQHKYHKYVISILIWSTLIIRYLIS